MEVKGAQRMPNAQQQRPESPRINISWRTSKHKVEKLHQGQMLSDGNLPVL